MDVLKRELPDPNPGIMASRDYKSYAQAMRNS
jgi:hypothetical protein